LIQASRRRVDGGRAFHTKRGQSAEEGEIFFTSFVRSCVGTQIDKSVKGLEPNSENLITSVDGRHGWVFVQWHGL
jgi:hypothetical protein